ncbi:MAG: RluA family pseudouridine synthase [Lautropia sp.]|nr:RluA family pseudouridine synthase [Lautropia sp.]
MDETPERIQLTASGGSGQRLDQFLASRLAGISRTRIQRWIALGAVQVDQRIRLPSLRLNGFEQIEIEPQPLDSERAFEPDPVPLDIVHQDQDVVVINKPAGLVTHPAPGHWRGTLMNGLLHADPKAAKLPRAGIVHRLDRDTSGLLVCARSEAAFTSLSAQLAERQMGRRYLAIAGGIAEATGTIDARIGRDARNRLRMAVVQAPQGKEARTHFTRLAVSGNAAASAVLCRLESGRTHQIRVHLAAIGHPLIGDALYGGKPLHGFSRQALHAWQLRFQHPANQEACRFDAPIPPDLQQLADRFGMTLPDTAPEID